ncbi:MAG: DUF177 domain-containing protein [candidate division Zixibacteria bacterium]|nr:DUF177 domain-containing protein [candidate division Zixibacteria bacterium]
MKLRLREYDTFPVRTCLEADPDSFEIVFDGVCGVREVTVDLDIQRSGDEFFCQADVRAVLILECARCLGHYDAELTTTMNFVVCSEVVFNELRKEAEDAEEYVFCVGDSQEADISNVVRQAIITAVPMLPLCAEDCRGLCPQCGANRNLHDCDCGQEVIDERWEGLRDLQDK